MLISNARIRGQMSAKLEIALKAAGVKHVAVRLVKLRMKTLEIRIEKDVVTLLDQIEVIVNLVRIPFGRDQVEMECNLYHAFC